MDLENGQTYEMQGSGKLPYKIKNVGGVYSCTCPAWCNQSKPSNARTCKHIIKLRGAAAEETRLANAGEQCIAAKRLCDQRQIRRLLERVAVGIAGHDEDAGGGPKLGKAHGELPER